jgi:hypothetical protein
MAITDGVRHGTAQGSVLTSHADSSLAFCMVDFPRIPRRQSPPDWAFNKARRPEKREAFHMR